MPGLINCAGVTGSVGVLRHARTTHVHVKSCVQYEPTALIFKAGHPSVLNNLICLGMKSLVTGVYLGGWVIFLSLPPNYTL